MVCLRKFSALILCLSLFAVPVSGLCAEEMPSVPGTDPGPAPAETKAREAARQEALKQMSWLADSLAGMPEAPQMDQTIMLPEPDQTEDQAEKLKP